MTRGLLAGCLSAALLAPAAFAADGPAPAAQAEKKKRKERKPASPSPAPPKVFTDDDLKKYSEERAGKAGEEGGEQAAGQESSESGSPIRPADEEYGGRQLWADRARQARDKITEAEERVAGLEARITELRTDRGASNAMDPQRLQTIQAEIQKATEELEATRKELQAAREGLEAVVEEARRQGVPAGWVREP
jgi:hypothetical protein